jgi:hypothetical protein
VTFRDEGAASLTGLLHGWLIAEYLPTATAVGEHHKQQTLDPAQQLRAGVLVLPSGNDSTTARLCQSWPRMPLMKVFRP